MSWIRITHCASVADDEISLQSSCFLGGNKDLGELAETCCKAVYDSLIGYLLFNISSRLVDQRLADQRLDDLLLPDAD